MPNYDVECPDCGQRGIVSAANTRQLGKCSCGAQLEWVPSCNVAVFKPFVHEHLGHEPVLIKSWKHYKEELKKAGGYNELGS